MSYDLETLAHNILNLHAQGGSQNRAKIDTLLAANPPVRKVKVAYSYTLEYGSDGCWDRTETRTCTLGEWLSGVEYRHPGNRSYGFQVTGVGA